MKNKGFTLIELLAVIIILAIIALIAMPLVLNTIEKARKGAAEASAYAYAEEVDRYLVLSQIDPTLPKLQPGVEYQLSRESNEVAALADPATTYINDLVDIKGDKPTKGYLKLNSENKIEKIEMVMKAYPVTCENDECKVTGDRIGNPDTEAPVLELGEVTVTYNTITIPITKNEDNKKDEPVVKVYYGTTESLGEEVTCSNDKCEITGLTQKTTYYYKVVSKDKAGNSTTLPKSGLSTTTTGEKEVLCKRATQLHTEKCENTSTTKSCRYAGYEANATITYGRLGESGTLTSGAAFDCDVKGDKSFSERFYYVTDSSAGNALLIYYSNTTAGVEDNYFRTNAITYNSSEKNWLGPVNAKVNLPTTKQWSNPKIIYPTTRAIVTETGATTVTITGSNAMTSAAITQNFSYSGYAARLLTTQEINKACKITVGSEKVGELVKNCLYMLERTMFSHPNKARGYWLETPSNKSYLGRYVWTILDDNVVDDPAHRDVRQGVRPVIEVAKEDIEI